MLTLHNIQWNSRQFSLTVPSLQFNDNSHSMIMGPSGSGKTLLLSILAGIVRPHRGNVYYHDDDITSTPPDMRNFSIIYQEPALFTHFSVFQNIAFGLMMKGHKNALIQKKVHEVMSLCNIEHLKDRDPGTLSGGEKQRVAFARAVVIRPKLMILDEPFTALDPVSKDELIVILQHIKRDYNPMILHVTHDFDETLMLGDYLYVAAKGRFIQHGTVADVYRFPQDIFVAKMVGAKNIFTGNVVVKQDGTYFITANGCELFVGDGYTGTYHHAVVRAEDIVLSKAMQKSSATNQFRGTVIDIAEVKGLYKVSIDIGEIVQSIITKRSLDAMNIRKNKNIVVMFKGSAVHLF